MSHEIIEKHRGLVHVRSRAAHRSTENRTSGTVFQIFLPDDPALASYWADRRKKVKPPLDRYSLRLLSRQDGLCPLCGDHLLSAGQPPQSPEQWERWWLHVTRKAIAASYLTHGRPGPADGDQTRLVHASCQRALQARQRRKPALQPATPSRLA